MKTTLVSEQSFLSVSSNSTPQILLDAPSLLQEQKRITLDLASRTLLLLTDNQVTRVVRLSSLDTQLLLPLFYFHPHHVSDATFAIGYTVDLLTYYRCLTGTMTLKEPETVYPIVNGIERLKKKIKELGITVVRVRNLGYVIDTGTRAFSTHNGRAK